MAAIEDGERYEWPLEEGGEFRVSVELIEIIEIVLSDEPIECLYII